jgi:hypothetical protein
MTSIQRHLRSLNSSTKARLCPRPAAVVWTRLRLTLRPQPRSVKWQILMLPHLPKLAALVALTLLMTGCDPTINLYGTFIPAWLICMAAGTAGAVALRYVFAALKLEPHLGPLILVYPCLVVLLSCLIWAIFFKL